MDRRRSVASGTLRGPMASAVGRGRACVHAFPAGAEGLDGAGGSWRRCRRMLLVCDRSARLRTVAFADAEGDSARACRHRGKRGGVRILFAIPHYFASDGVGYHGSTGPDPGSRQAALAGCIGALHGLFAGPAVETDWGERRFLAANTPRHHVDVVVLTVTERHALKGVRLSADLYRHREVDCTPLELGHAARAFLADRL